MKEEGERAIISYLIACRQNRKKQYNTNHTIKTLKHFKTTKYNIKQSQKHQENNNKQSIISIFSQKYNNFGMSTK